MERVASNPKINSHLLILSPLFSSSCCFFHSPAGFLSCYELSLIMFWMLGSSGKASRLLSAYSTPKSWSGYFLSELLVTQQMNDYFVFQFFCLHPIAIVFVWICLWVIILCSAAWREWSFWLQRYEIQQFWTEAWIISYTQLLLR